MLALALAIASATLAIGWIAFHQLRDDLAGSNARLPAKIGSVLSGAAPSPGSGTFLIAAPGGGIPGAVLMRVDPTTGVATTVELDSGATIGAKRVGDLTAHGDVTALIGALAQAGVPVNHVLLLQPGQIGTMIDALGGVAVADPTASPEQRQLNGLAAIGSAVLEPSSPTLRTPNHLGGVIAKNAATDLTATTYLDELHAWGDIGRSVSCSAVDPTADATSMLRVLAGQGAGSATGATCSTASVRPSGWFGWLGLLGSDPADMLVLAAGLALLGTGICLLVLELTSTGFRTLRDRRRWAGAEAEAGSPQTAAPPPVLPPPAGRRRLRLPQPLRRRGQPAQRSHRRRFDPGKPRLGLPSWWTRRRTAAVSGGFLVGHGRFRRHHQVVGGRGSLAGYAAVLAVAVGSGFVIAQLLTR
jgi:hypothetical protein